MSLRCTYLNMEWLISQHNSLVCYKSDTTQNALFFRRSFWKSNFLAITEEREMYLIISISKHCKESYQFHSTYTVISGLLDDVDNSKLQNFELCHSCSKQANYLNIEVSLFEFIINLLTSQERKKVLEHSLNSCFSY